MSNIEILHNVELPTYYANNRVNYKVWEKFPYLYLNGTFCFPINSYLQSFEIIHLSYLSILKIAYALNTFLKYCEEKNILIENFSEQNLINLSHFLKEEIDENNNKKRNNTSVNYILNYILNFYNFYGNTFLDEKDYCYNFFNVKTVLAKNKFKEITKFSHPCFLPKSEKRTRNPISNENIQKIRDAVYQLSNNKFIQQRTKVLIKLLEITGARVTEIINLSIFDIENANSQDKPMLKLKTIKRRSEHFRYVPVDKNDLREIITFIKVYRSKIVKNTLFNKDHGALFISEKNGQKLEAITVSNELIRLRNIANIDQETCAHMFRHRYITNMFINLIKQYDLQNQDSFRNALMDINNLKVHIQQLTGHKNLLSLDNYIHLAKSELTNMNGILNKVSETQTNEAKEREQKRLLEELKLENIDLTEYIKSIENLLNP